MLPRRTVDEAGESRLRRSVIVARLATAPLCRCGPAPSRASRQEVPPCSESSTAGTTASRTARSSADYPDESVYPLDSFRVEWGPVFHRGRLDGTARVLVLGQDPAAHEAIARRILVGEAGQRVQGLLTRLGIDRSYVFVNTYLYSVFGQRRGERHIDDAAITDYRNRWLDAIVKDQPIEAIITLGHLADTAYQQWRTTAKGAAQLGRLRHGPAPDLPRLGEPVEEDHQGRGVRPPVHVVERRPRRDPPGDHARTRRSRCATTARRSPRTTSRRSPVATSRPACPTGCSPSRPGRCAPATPSSCSGRRSQ